MSHHRAPRALPDLAPLGVSIRWHPDGTAFDVEYFITNAGDASAPGGFQIGVTAQYLDHDPSPPQTVTPSEIFIFQPPTGSIEPGDIMSSGYLQNIPFKPNKLDPEYPKVSYTFYCTVDVEDQVAESDKQNNAAQNPMDIAVPRITPVPVGPIRQ